MKLALYFGTQESVYVISKHFGVNHTDYTPFSSQFLIKLAREGESSFVVSVQYNKVDIELGGDCKGETSCPYDNFLIFIKSLRADDGSLKDCKPVQALNMYTMSNNFGISNQQIMMFGAFFITAMIVAIVIGICTKSSKKIFNRQNNEALLV